MDHAAKPVGFEATEYGCRKCSDQFTTIDGYYVHMFSQHKIRNPKRNKPIIKRVFQQLDQNTMTANTIGNTDDSMDCGYCDKHYLTHGSLRNHLTKVHEDQPLYFCDTCDRAFYVDSVRDKHCSNCSAEKLSKNKGTQITDKNSTSKKKTPAKTKYNYFKRTVTLPSGEKELAD